MSTPARPDVDCEMQHPSLAVADVGAAVAHYTEKLGFSLAFTIGDPPTFAGLNLGRVQLFVHRGTPSPGGCSVYFVVADADELHAFHQASGVDIVGPPADRDYALRDYRVRDLDGYALDFGHRLLNQGPPVEIERVAVPVRLEKRLAALLVDLAAHKRTTVDACIEEILLHTCEPLGGGVASPHTPRTLRWIAERKRVHGIDYEVHDCYRFVEK